MRFAIVKLVQLKIAFVDPAILRQTIPISRVSTAGKIKQIKAIASQSMPVMAAFAPVATSLTQPAYTPMGPTMPQVPIPEATPPAGSFIWNWNTQVAIGPVMAEANVGGIQILGFFTILPIWSMEVPKP